MAAVERQGRNEGLGWTATMRSRPKDRPVSYYNSLSWYPSVGAQAWVADADLGNATAYAMTIEDQDNDTRLYLGAARSLDLPSHRRQP